MTVPGMLRRKLSSRARRRRFAAVCGLMALLARPVWAASLSPQDLQILASALAFVQPQPSGEVVVAIVHAGRDTGSYQDAAAILAAFGKSLTASDIVLTPRLADADELATIGFSLVIVAAGANSEGVQRAVRSHHALCVTADQAAVQQGLCMIAIRSAGKVEILLNYRAAQAAGIKIATAFRMMVGEL